MSVQLDGPTTPIQGVAELTDLAMEGLEHLSGPDAAAELALVLQATAKLEAYRVGVVARIEKSQVWRADDPNGTAASFLRREHSLDHVEAKSDLRAAAAFGVFPELAAAAREGRISRKAVDAMLTVGLKTVRRQKVFAEFLPLFVKLAELAPLSLLRAKLTEWADQVDAQATAKDEADAHDRRYLFVTLMADGVKMDGYFDTTNGIKIMTAMNAILADLYKNPPAEADGGDAADSHQPAALAVLNSSAKQRADAFITGIIDPILNSGLLPTSGGALPHVIVTVPAQRLANPSESLDVDTVRAGLIDGTSRLNSAHIEASNGPGRLLISTAHAQMLSCDANVQRILLSPESVPLDVGRKQRLIPPDMRRTLNIRDGGCVFPYCDKPSAWCQAHHILHWSNGGDTALHNLALLCQKHHTQIHNQGHEITMNAIGKPEVKLRHLYRN